jgi:hypothetical protein
MLDPLAIPRYLAFVIRAGVQRFGWKVVIVGWIFSTIAAVILNFTT